jgi:membrane protease YdiL (CAAX protease family)
MPTNSIIRDMITALNPINREWSAIEFQVPWKFKDVLIIFLISCFSILLLMILSGLFFKITGLVLGNFLYFYGFTFLFVPIIRIKRAYNAKVQTLGIRKGRWPISYIVAIGIGAGVGYHFVTYAISGPQLKIDQFVIQNFYSIILSKLTFTGVYLVFLAPISEEIFHRGFLYGYLRGRLGVLFGLLTQALIFSLFHLDLEAAFSGQIPLIIHKFCLGLVLGALYEISGSLYPSLVCHAVFNFLTGVS